MSIIKVDYGTVSGGGELIHGYQRLTDGTWIKNSTLTISGLTHKPCGFVLFMSDGYIVGSFGEGNTLFATNRTNTYDPFGESYHVSYTDDGFTIPRRYDTTSNRTYMGWYFYEE